MVLLMNSSIMPVDGVYEYYSVDRAKFVMHLKQACEAGVLKSYIGYPATAEHIERISGVRPRVSRDHAIPSPGDMILVCKLRYRIGHPSQKGELQPEDDDFEYGVVFFSPRQHTLSRR